MFPVCLFLGNHTKPVNVAQFSSAGFVATDLLLSLVTVWPYYKAIQEYLSDVESIFVSVFSYFPLRSTGAGNSDNVLNHLSVCSSLYNFS